MRNININSNLTNSNNLTDSNNLTNSNIYNSKKIFKFFLYSHITLVIAIILYTYTPFNKLISYIDLITFEFLNNFLLRESSILQTIFGWLNHRKETKLNLLVMAGINLVSIVYKKDNKTRFITFIQILYFWGFFQIGFMLQDYYFNTYAPINKLSPSAIIKPCVLLSEVFNNPQIKDISYNCFPSGHALSLTFWLIFSIRFLPKKLKAFTLIIGTFMFLPRMFSGAHWLSDLLFSIVLSCCWMGWAVLPCLKKKSLVIH